jgi:hypothetical protein
MYHRRYFRFNLKITIGFDWALRGAKSGGETHVREIKSAWVVISVGITADSNGAQKIPWSGLRRFNDEQLCGKLLGNAVQKR